MKDFVYYQIKLLAKPCYYRYNKKLDNFDGWSPYEKRWININVGIKNLPFFI